MASLFKIQKRYVVEVSGVGRISVGRLKGKAAECFHNIELIEQAYKAETEIPPRCQEWLRTEAPAKVLLKLRQLGLTATESRSLGDLLRLFRSTSAGRKPSTLVAYETCFNTLLDYFDASTLIGSIREPQAREFRGWLQNDRKLAEATISRRICYLRTLWKLAIQHGWALDNVWKDVKAGKQHNSRRAHFVTAEDAATLAEGMPDQEYRLAVLVARWCGVRVPSELLPLKWSDVDFKRRSVRIYSPKTDSVRECPLFPQVFDELRKAAGEGWIFPKLREMRNPDQSLRKLALAALKSAGIDPWPRLFANLRATRATEVADEFGAKAESDWIGHGAEVALKHYLMVSEDVWKRAVDLK